MAYNQVPVYLPDQTVIGTAHVAVEEGQVAIMLQVDSNTAELFKEDLLGLSVMYMDKNKVEEIEQSREKKTDGTT